MQPTQQHQNFLRAGKALTTIAKSIAIVDLPEKLTFPPNRPIILAGNHRSFFDFPAAMAIFTKFGLSCRIFIRADVMEKGPGAAFFNGVGAIPASKELRERSEAMAIEALEAGELVCLMPEGKLVKPADWVNGVGPARPGVSRVARATGAVVIPVAFAGAEKVWPRGSAPKVQFPRPRVTLRLGDPIDFETDDHEANAAEVMAGIASVLATIE